MWLPVTCPWEFRGTMDTGPPAGLRVRSLGLRQDWFGDGAGPLASGGAVWAGDVRALVLLPPLGAAIRTAASCLTGFFCNACEIEIPERLKSSDDITAATELICAMGPRLRRLIAPRCAKFRNSAAVRLACPWVQHFTWRDTDWPDSTDWP